MFSLRITQSYLSILHGAKSIEAEIGRVTPAALLLAAMQDHVIVPVRATFAGKKKSVRAGIYIRATVNGSPAWGTPEMTELLRMPAPDLWISMATGTSSGRSKWTGQTLPQVAPDLLKAIIEIGSEGTEVTPGFFELQIDDHMPRRTDDRRYGNWSITFSTHTVGEQAVSGRKRNPEGDGGIVGVTPEIEATAAALSEPTAPPDAAPAAPEPRTPAPMPESVAKPILDAYARMGGKKLTAETGKEVVRAWLLVGGWRPDAWGNFLRPGVPDRRRHFKATVFNDQRKLNGAWYNIESRPIIAQATHLVRRAAEAMGDTALAQRMSATQEKKKEARVKAKTKAEEEKAARDVMVQVAKVAAFEDPESLAKNLRGELLSDAKFAALRTRGEEIKAEITSGARVVRDEDVASADAPPILPIYRDVDLEWTDTSTGVPYTISVSHANKGEAKIFIGAGAFGVDPSTHAIVGRGAYTRKGAAEGDGILTGRIVWKAGEGKKKGYYYGSIFFVSASERRQGAGTRLMSIWCRMMRGYGANGFVAEAVGNEGQAYLEALDKKGMIKILGRQGNYWTAQCGAPA